MHLVDTDSRRGRLARRIPVGAGFLVLLLLTGTALLSRSASADTVVPASPLAPAAAAEVNVTELALQQSRLLSPAPPVRPLIFPGLNEEMAEPEFAGPVPLAPMGFSPARLMSPLIASPGPALNYQGLDDIPMVDSSYIVIPPDVNGAVGPTKVLEFLNNNLRIRDKATGATQLTVGTATFWAPVTTVPERNQLTDPRTTYDPYNCCFITVMQTVTANAVVLVGVSQTSDPAGAWWLYRFSGLTGSAGGNYLLDYPILGYNKNWVAVTIGRFTSAGAFSYDVCLALNYPQLRVGVGSGSLFTLSGGAAATHFCASPAITLSPTEDSLFVVTHLSSGGATFVEDVISGTPAAPVYTASGTTNVRPGGGWTQPSGNIQPQSAPNAGASACGATPCPIETQDAQVRSAPIYRNGFVYYAQTIRLTTPANRTIAQWTKITPSLTPAFADGGRLDDATGAKWYDNVSLVVNARNDFLLGFTQFGAGQHPSAGYAVHLDSDGPGTLRDAFIYKAGEDYYHKTFTTTTGRNRWGDFSTCQIDPCDDQSMWTIQEYAKTRTASADDGNTGSNSSRWSTWWAQVAGPALAAGLTCAPDQIAAPGSSVTLTFRVTNTGTATGTFNYLITDVNGWGGPLNGTTPPLAPSSFFDVFITLKVPADCNPANDAVTFCVTPNGSCPNCYPTQCCTMHLFCDIATATLVSRFDAAQGGAGVDLSWASDAVDQVQAWNVYRAPALDGAWTRINTDPIAMGAGGQFQLHDAGATSGTLFYRLAALLPGGGEQMVSSTQIVFGGRPFVFSASSNPFSGHTTLLYALPRAERVQINVYTVTGQRIRTLVDGTESPGNHSVDFSLRDGGRAITPGVYLVRISAGSNQKTLRLVGMK